MAERKRGTSTSNFGVGKRESHDASAFYARFTFPTISQDDALGDPDPAVVDTIQLRDARDMSAVPSNTVALVVTSPPYFAGKEYEQALGQGIVPASYLEYLEMLHDSFAECVRVLEPGGRIAVNVANLGRKPYRSLAADIIHILQDRLGLLLRGEIVWQKGRGASGSCAWGSFQSSANPVLRDITERIIVASKGRFDRAVPRRKREKADRPSAVSISKDDFVEYTLDVWDIPAESATRVGHPAPFPVELPQRLIDLYTYRGDIVLDPFMGSGTTAVAALRSRRHYIGFEVDERYRDRALERIEKEKEDLVEADSRRRSREVLIPAIPQGDDAELDHQSRAVRDGKRAREMAHEALVGCGFEAVEADVRVSGVEVNFAARDQNGERWFFDVSGAFTTHRPGLKRTDTLWKALGRAAVLKGSGVANYRLIFLTTDLPSRGSTGDLALRAVRGDLCHDVIPMLSAAGIERLRLYATGQGRDEPLGELLIDAEE
ncbi:MAG TPA: site-specific DNA-methyltransferase [Actinomycetota bacterium]|nr:site-specific DNA-methyltransferase [Actinomycetota bacterium]